MSAFGTFAVLLIIASLIYYAARFVKHKRSGASVIDAARAVTAEESLEGRHSERRARNEAAWADLAATRAAVKERAASQPSARDRANMIRARRDSGMSRKEAIAEDRRLYGKL